MRKSKLNTEKKQREIIRLRKMTPAQRLKAQARLTARVKTIFFSGLSHQGFDRKEITRMWKVK